MKLFVNKKLKNKGFILFYIYYFIVKYVFSNSKLKLYNIF